jgi:hypothetical protein
LPPGQCRAKSTTWEDQHDPTPIARGREIMSKRARKRRDRNKKGANHGKKPNT